MSNTQANNPINASNPTILRPAVPATGRLNAKAQKQAQKNNAQPSASQPKPAPAAPATGIQK